MVVDHISGLVDSAISVRGAATTDAGTFDHGTCVANARKRCGFLLFSLKRTLKGYGA